MKRTAALMIFMLVLFIPFSAAFANSMPGHWMSGKSGGSVFVLSGENLAVEHETLSFDIPETYGMLDVANVIAQYHIQNEGEARTVTMLFPILFSREDVGVMAEGMKVLVDSRPVPFSFTVLDTISGDYTDDEADVEALRESCSIENILAQMREKGITAGQFKPSEFLDKYNKLYDMDYSNKLLLVMYDVSFEAGETHDVQVQYVQRATLFSDDKPNYQHPLFYYLLSPAKTFEKFGTLDITVKIDKPFTQFSAPGFDFNRKGGVYSASFDGLPSQDLYFTVKHDSQTLFEKHPILTFFLIVYILVKLVICALYAALIGIVYLISRVFLNLRKRLRMKRPTPM